MNGAEVIAGFYGKLPARGDFVRAGLPRSFTDPWDDWLRLSVAGSREAMGEDWLPIYLESPIWRFSLAAGVCGALPAVGLMLPSVDKAGRYFPLTFAALCATTTGTEAWLDRCEDAGLAALEQEAAPESIAVSIGQPVSALHDRDRAAGRSHDTVWWTQGSPRVPETRLSLPGLPDVATYISMLGGAAVFPDTGPMEEASWKSQS